MQHEGNYDTSCFKFFFFFNRFIHLCSEFVFRRKTIKCSIHADPVVMDVFKIDIIMTTTTTEKKNKKNRNQTKIIIAFICVIFFFTAIYVYNSTCYEILKLPNTETVHDERTRWWTAFTRERLPPRPASACVYCKIASIFLSPFS